MSASRAVVAPGDEQAIALLEGLLSRYSPSSHEARAVAYLVDAMARLGYEAESDEAGNAVGHLGDGPQQIVLLGHIDTVPGEVPVRREGQALYGRGAVDAKGPLATFVCAVARAAAQGLLGALRVTVIGAVEEEAATSKGARYAAERYQPAATIIGEPSGWQHVTLGYKGRLLLDYRLERPMAHSAGEQAGAAEVAVAYWLALSRWAERFNADKQGRFATLDPSLRHIHSTSDGLRESVEMTIGLRLPPELDVHLLLATMQDWRAEAQVTTRGYEQPFRADKRTPLASALLAAIRAEGGQPTFLTKTGTSDMNVVGPLWAGPIVAYGPGDSSLDHTPNEHILIPEYLAAVRVLTRVLQRLGAGALD